MEIVELRHGNVAHMDGDVMIARTCSRCKELKKVSDYTKHKTGYLGVSTSCKECRAKKRRVDAGARRVYNDKWREENREKYVEGNRAYYNKTRESAAERKRAWRKDNRELEKAQQLRRRARKRGLVDDLTGEQMLRLIEKFGGCALTGSDDIHFDHVIPLATGFGGTTYSNMIPLRCDLNTSKNAKNIFEWFEDVHKREQLSRERFNKLIEHLSEATGMTVDEYREHVYKCHEGVNK